MVTTATAEAAVPACLGTLNAVQQQIDAAMPGLASRIGPCIDRPQLRLANDERIWLLSPLSCDPLTGPDGRYVLPPLALLDLGQIAAAGIEFHGMVVGHELDLTGPAGRLVPQLRDGPKSCPSDVAKALVGPVPEDPRAAHLAGSLGRILTAVGSSAGARPRRAGASMPLLDPVIFGLIAADGVLQAGRPVLWVACAKWEW